MSSPLKKLKPGFQCHYCEDLDENKEEVIVLTNNKLLSLYESINNNETDERPQHRITQFIIHDSDGVFCGFDSRKIENGFDIYLCGFVKPIVIDNDVNKNDNSEDNTIEAQRIGPLIEWWFAGFDGGSEPVIGVESLYASYVLSEPHQQYEKLFVKSSEKILLTKIIIETLLKCPETSFDDLIDSIEQRDQYFNEELVLFYGSFIIEQIKSFDDAAEEDEDLVLMETQAVQSLVEMSGISDKSLGTNHKTVSHIRPIARIDARRAANSDTLTSSTPLVRKFFDSIFNDIIEGNENPPKVLNTQKLCDKRLIHIMNNNKTINWIGNAFYEDKFARKTYYKSFKMNDQIISSGDFVEFRNMEDFVKLGRIVFAFNTCNSQKCHIQYFCNGKNTILGETALNSEVFMTTKCDNIKICDIIEKINIYLSKPLDLNEYNGENSEQLICRKLYKKSGRFEDLPQEIFDSKSNCVLCFLKDMRIKQKTPELGEQIPSDSSDVQKFKSLSYKEQTYCVGDSAFISTEAFNLPHFEYKESNSVSIEEYDETLYPEKYRKAFTDYVKGLNTDSAQPLCVGYIKEIIKSNIDSNGSTKIVVNVFYRPENIIEKYEDYRCLQLNLLFWTKKQITVNVESLEGICNVFYSEKLETEDFYLKPNVFQFNQCYDFENNTFFNVSEEIRENFPKIQDKNDSALDLKILDLFSGCGGLSYGFKKAGFSSKVYAIEKDPSAYNSFKLNFPSAMVFEEDANHFLDLLLKGIKTDKNNQRLPQKGEIDMIIGGPPCQGFSGMNRFSSRQYSLFKNSLVVSFLSYIDFYRPKYLIFENVRNFAIFKSSMILKMTLSCLIRMGYQCQFAILQSGSYGLPQTRRRTVIIGSQSGHKLPNFPEPTHCFSLRQCQLSVNIDDRKYTAITKNCAQFRAITVDDAISDLPVLGEDYASEKIRQYERSDVSHYQKLMRIDSDTNVSQHFCKQLSPLCRARIDNIPHCVGSDWRDLPNISCLLSDGSVAKKLEYLYNDLKNGKNNQLRGVCMCASGRACNGSDSRQENTLIPWCLVHTSNRQYHWSGLYGRLSLRGYFPTTVTNPEPISKQGRVLHPNQNRIISIRESARSQGFPDHFIFFGSVSDKYRQIGNAVPIPLAIALALEFRKVLE